MSNNRWHLDESAQNRLLLRLFTNCVDSEWHAMISLWQFAMARLWFGLVSSHSRRDSLIAVLKEAKVRE
jgi:hypothetical protein